MRKQRDAAKVAQNVAANSNFAVGVLLTNSSPVRKQTFTNDSDHYSNALSEASARAVVVPTAPIVELERVV